MSTFSHKVSPAGLPLLGREPHRKCYNTLLLTRIFFLFEEKNKHFDSFKMQGKCWEKKLVNKKLSEFVVQIVAKLVWRE